MKITPSVLYWSYHRQFGGQWDSSLDSFIEKVVHLKEKYSIPEMGIDLAMAPGQDAFKSYDERYLLEVKDKLDKAGLRPIPVVGKLDIHADPDAVEASIQALEKKMQIAQILGADTIQFFQNVHGRLSREKAVRVYHDAAAKLNQLAEKYALTMASEEYCGLNGNEIYLAVKDTPRVGLLNDIGNWMILGEDPVAVTKKFIGITNHVHLKDYVFEDGIWKSVPFGQGIVDLKCALDILYEAPGDKPLYASFETDLDSGDEDEAMDLCFQYYQQWRSTKEA